MSRAEAGEVETDEAFLLYKQFVDERDKEGITEMRLHGFDPEKVPRYREKIRKPIEKQMTQAEKDTYTSVVKNILQERYGRKK